MAECTITCISISGSGTIYENYSYEYIVSLNTEHCTNTKKIRVFLSYVAGTLQKDIDFTAPSFVDIEPGNNEVKFVVNTHTDCTKDNNLYLQIDITTNENINICSNIVSRLECGKGDSCGEMFFFAPYGHPTKKPSNTNMSDIS